MKADEYKALAIKAIKGEADTDTIVKALREAAQERSELEGYRTKFGELRKEALIWITCRKMDAMRVRIYEGFIDEPNAPCNTLRYLNQLHDELQVHLDEMNERFLANVETAKTKKKVLAQ